MQHCLIDGGNAGDEYDYSPPANDSLVAFEPEDVSVLENNPLRAALAINGVMHIPETTADGRGGNTKPMAVRTCVYLGRDDAFIDIETTVENNSGNHRLQVLFDLGECTDRHIADIQLGEQERENYSELTEESIKEGWSERYYPVYTQQKYIALYAQDGQGLMLMNRGIPQYEIQQGETTVAALTLLSCVGRMGNENLLYRPGRRSGAVCDTPDSQMAGTYTFEYRLACVGQGCDRHSMAEAYCNPVRTQCWPEYDCSGILPDSFHPLSVEGGIDLKAFKAAQQSDAFILRFANANTAAIDKAVISTPKGLFAQCEICDTEERTLHDGRSGISISWENNPDCSDEYRFGDKVTCNSLPPHGLVTLKLRQ